jgi:hypothetical protein
MTIKNLLLLCFLLPAFFAKAQSHLTTQVSNTAPPVSQLSGDMVSEIKMAKEYYMTSNAPDAGQTYDERKKNLSTRTRKIFEDFSTKRTNQYKEVRIVFTDYDWKTNGTITTTANIPANVYTFYQMQRTTNGDWKGGPSINGADRSGWFSGDIPGGAVSWRTGGHHHSETHWTIRARYADNYISSLVDQDVRSVKSTLQSMNLPTD